jgi:hypothetical protein
MTTEQHSKTEKLQMTTTTKVNSDNVQKNDIMAFIYYARVDRNDHGNTLKIYDLDNDKEMWVSGRQLIEKSFSADQYDKEEKVSKTKAAEILTNAHNRPLSVCFVKIDGTDRIIRGRLINPEPLLGRSKVEDLDYIGESRIRLVDHRTIKWIVVDGVKYVVK